MYNMYIISMYDDMYDMLIGVFCDRLKFGSIQQPLTAVLAKTKANIAKDALIATRCVVQN